MSGHWWVRSQNCFNRFADYFVLALVSTLFFAHTAPAIGVQNVLVLYNADSTDSIRIAEYYAQIHPGVELLGLNGVSTAEEIDQDHYLNVIRPQVLAGMTDNVDVIVTTKGLPLRIKNTQSNPLTYAGWRGEPFGVPIFNSWWKPYSSLESELTRIDLIDSAEMMGDQAAFMSPSSFPFASDHHAANPYFNATQAFDHESSAVEGIRLAARLDGFTVNDVKAMIDRAQTALSMPLQQLVVIDDDPNAPATKVDRMAQLGFNVLEPSDHAMVYDNTGADIVDASQPVIGYVGHGSHAAGKNYIDSLRFDLADGAVFHTWESYNAYSFVEGKNKYGQGLVGEWIAAGGTAALGHVHEPTASTATVANEDIFWDRLLNGFTLAEAAWAATPQLSYVNTLVGDPLMTLVPWVTGDANLDGFVGIQDLTVVLSNWNRPTAGRVGQGDFDQDGFVGINDLNLLLSNWLRNVGGGSTLIVPEPWSVSTMLGGVAALTGRRKRRASDTTTAASC